MNVKRRTEAGWSAAKDGTDGCSVSRKSDFGCGRRGMPGPWTKRVLPNGDPAHRDCAVRRRGGIRHIKAVWPNTRRPFPRP